MGAHKQREALLSRMEEVPVHLIPASTPGTIQPFCPQGLEVAEAAGNSDDCHSRQDMDHPGGSAWHCNHVLSGFKKYFKNYNFLNFKTKSSDYIMLMGSFILPKLEPRQPGNDWWFNEITEMKGETNPALCCWGTAWTVLGPLSVTAVPSPPSAQLVDH